MATPGQVFDFEVNDSSLLGLFHKIDSFTDVGQGGIIGIFILMVVGGVLFLMMKGFGNERALSVTMLVVSILGFLLRFMGLIGDIVFYICLILLVLGIAFLIKDSEKYE
jgi:hypothetical protein